MLFLPLSNRLSVCFQFRVGGNGWFKGLGFEFDNGMPARLLNFSKIRANFFQIELKALRVFLTIFSNLFYDRIFH